MKINQRPLLLTIEDAYDSSQYFIEKCWNKTNSFDSGIIASEMTLFADDRPFDSAVWDDWFEALNTIKPNEDLNLQTTQLTIDEAYFTMVAFLEIYCNLGAEDDFKTFVGSLKTKTSTIVTWQDWLDSIQEITNHQPRIRPYAELLPK